MCITLHINLTKNGGVLFFSVVQPGPFSYHDRVTLTNVNGREIMQMPYSSSQWLFAAPNNPLQLVTCKWFSPISSDTTVSVQCRGSIMPSKITDSSWLVDAADLSSVSHFSLSLTITGIVAAVLDLTKLCFVAPGSLHALCSVNMWKCDVAVPLAK